MKVWAFKGNRIRASNNTFGLSLLYWLAVAPVCCGVPAP